MSDDAFRDALGAFAPEFGLSLSAAAIEQFSTHYEMLLTWNRKINLTRITAPEDAARYHFLESAFLSTLLREPPARLVDVGSGGGFPGLPLACIWPGVPMLLIEPLGKRAVFLKEVVRVLGLAHVSVRNERFRASQVDPTTLVVARALDRFEDLLPALLGSSAERVALYAAPELLARAAVNASGRTAARLRLPSANRRFIGLFDR